MVRYFVLIAIALTLSLAVAQPPQKAKPAPKPTFERDVKPFLKKYCNLCHTGKDAAGNINLAAVKTENDVKELSVLMKKSVTTLNKKTMPPKAQKAQPTASETKKFIAYAKAHS